MKILGLITARGGSKRVPRKNIKNFLGKPLLVWSIELAKKSGVLDRLILTTDDEEIAEIGRKYGVEVPFMRPAEFASDTASSDSVIKHAVNWLKEHERYEAPWVITFEPSSPGRQLFHVREVAKIIQKRDDFDSLVGISQVPSHFSYTKEWKIESATNIITRAFDGALVREKPVRNQEVPKTYCLNGAIYASRTSNFYKEAESMYGDSSYGYLMDDKYNLDIDTLEEWNAAEEKMKALLKEGH